MYSDEKVGTSSINRRMNRSARSMNRSAAHREILASNRKKKEMFSMGVG
jgi:hypothetical protein